MYENRYNRQMSQKKGKKYYIYTLISIIIPKNKYTEFHALELKNIICNAFFFLISKYFQAKFNNAQYFIVFSEKVFFM